MPKPSGMNRSVIVGFRSEEARLIFNGFVARCLPRDIQTVRRRKLILLEALKGDRRGQHSIRVNGQGRICFVWKDGNATEVEIVDYH